MMMRVTFMRSRQNTCTTLVPLRKLYFTGLVFFAILAFYEVFHVISQVNIELKYRYVTDNDITGIQVTTETTSITEPVQESLIVKPFAPKQPHLVLILSYQRCGSSFFGGLFDNNVNEMYTYEPLDGLYVAMYGTETGWNVPADIMNWSNGSQRDIPRTDSDEVSKFLGDLLNCRYFSLPTEFLLHPFLSWRTMNLSRKKYVQCLNKTKQLGPNPNVLCHALIKKHCPRRFGNNDKSQALCNEILMNKSPASQTQVNITMKKSITKKPSKINKNIQQSFDKYKTCMKEHRMKAKPCVTELVNTCKKSRLRSTKTVRATMLSVEPLVANNPNLRVIHLIRDPRAVVISRRVFSRSGQSLYSSGGVVKEAVLFCRNLVRDITLRHELEARYPGTFMEVLFDNFVLDPIGYTQRIYEFMDMPLTKKISQWVKANTQGRRNSKNIALKWQNKLSYADTKEITKYCRPFFDMIDHNLPIVE